MGRDFRNELSIDAGAFLVCLVGRDTLSFRQIGFLEPSQPHESDSEIAPPLIRNNLRSIRDVIVNPFCVLDLKANASSRRRNAHRRVHHAIAVDIVWRRME